MAKEIVVKVDGDIKGLEKAVDKADDTLGKLGGGAEKAGGKLSGLGGKAGGLAKDHLGPLGDAADMAGVGLDGVGSGALVAGAAVAGLATFVAGGVTKLGEMTDEVRKFKDSSGATWEESSRMVAVFDDLGVSAETGAAAMGRLAKNVDAGKFAEFGIEVVRANDGTVDMVATLGNAADAMNDTTDPAKRAAMGTALFGKSWAELMPVLQQGSGGIREAMDGVADYQIVTAESAAEQREMSLAVDDLQDAISGLQMALASDLIPQLTKMASEGAGLVNMVNDLTDKVGGLGTVLKVIDWGNPVTLTKALFQDAKGRYDELRGTVDGAKTATGELGKTIGAAGVAAATAEKPTFDFAAAEREAGEAGRILTARQKDAAAAVKEMGDQAKIQEDKVRSLRDLTLSIAGTQLAYEAAQRSSTAAAIELATKTEELRVARQTYGEQSPQAVEAQLAYEGALGGTKEAADKLALATVEQARQQAIAAGQTFTAEQGNIVYRDSLVKIRDASTDPAFVDGMNGLIGLVDDTAGSAGEAARKFYELEAAASRAALVAAGVVSSTGQLLTSADAAERAVSGRAMGGPASGVVTVGERGPEQVILPEGSRVVPNHASMSAGGGVTVNVQTGADPWAIAREVDWVMRTAGR